MTSLLAFLKLLRPLNLLLGALSVLVSAAILDSLDNKSVLLKVILVVVALNAAANSFNDYCDIEIDRINRSNRPLPRGYIPRKWALIAAVFLFSFGILLSTFINTNSFVIASLIAVPFMITYSIWFKAMPLVGNVIIALILGLTFIFTGAAFENIGGLLVPALLAFGFTLVRELIKDIADVEGDKTARLNTVPVRFGIISSIRLASLFILLLGIGVVIPYFLGIYGKSYLIVLILGIEIPLIFIVSSLMKFSSIKTCKISAQILKACIFAGLLAVYLG